MKKMIRNIKTLAALLVAGAAITACSSDNDIAEQTVNPTGKYTMTLQATKGSEAITRALELNGETKALNATWKKGDEVKVYALNWEKYLNTPIYSFDVPLGTLTAQNDGTECTLTGEITAPPAVPDVYKDKVEVTPIILVFPRYPYTFTGQKGTLEDIATNFDYASLLAINWTESDGMITSEETVKFNNETQTIVRFTLEDKSGNAINATSLTLHDAKNHLAQSADMSSADFGDITVTPDNASSEIWVSILNGSNTTFDFTLTAETASGDTYTYTKSGVRLYSSMFYSFTVKMEK